MAAKAKQKPNKQRCKPQAAATGRRDVSLPVVGIDPETGMKRSKSGKRRAAVLIGLHLLMIGHFVHWRMAGNTLTPIEPSESVEFFRKAEINMGFIFFAFAILLTLIFGRFVCGWGCHIVAYQDFMLWILKKLRMRPKAFRTRFLVFIPLVIAAGWMFLWPIAVWVWMQLTDPNFTPTTTWHLTRTGFWDTFAGPVFGSLTILICGFLIVYFLGPKGFCTYGCPYGAFFGAADRVAPVRIRVNDNCEQCGHCTAVCTSNVSVSEEVNLYGMVVDPGCMKCLDCVSVCPNDALYLGAGAPAAFAKPSKPRKARRYDLSWPLEIFALVVFMFVLVTVNGLYGQFPFLMSLGIAGISTFVFMKALALVTQRDVLVQKMKLKAAGRLRPAGFAFGAVVVLLFAGYAHSAVWRYHDIRADHPRFSLMDVMMNRGFAEYAPAEYPGWQYDQSYRAEIAPNDKRLIETAIHHYEAAADWGIRPTPMNDIHLAWLYAATNERERAVEVMRQVESIVGDDPGFQLRLAMFETAAGNDAAAESAYKRAIKIESENRESLSENSDVAHYPLSAEIWAEWGLFQAFRSNDLAGANDALQTAARLDGSFVLKRAHEFTQQNQLPVAAAFLRAYLQEHDGIAPRLDYGSLLFVQGDLMGAAREYSAILEREPNHSQAAYRLGVTLLRLNRVDEALRTFRITREHGSAEEIAELDALCDEFSLPKN